ncbi:MAG TPA: cytochrome C oxidase subunit IV family protein [Sandaracinaceae bacterium]
MEITLRRIAIVTAVLMVLAAASWGAAVLHLPPAAAVGVALGVATIKVALVALFFMELGRHRGGVRLVAVTAPLFLAILLLLTLADVWTR